MKHIFIIGSRGLPAKYGGFETFVEQLVAHQQDPTIQYHVACLSDTEHQTHFDFNGVDCFTINPPKLGPARVIAYDMLAIRHAISIVKKQAIDSPVFYILGNTIGGFIVPFAHMIHSVGGKLLVNPDGLEWKRAKWPKPVQAYLKFSEKMMAQKADLIVADNQGIEDYLHQAYPGVKTQFIAYGTDQTPSQLTSDSFQVRELFEQWDLKEGQYFLMVGRFVPENNYEWILKEFLQSKTKIDLVIVCNYQGSAYFEKLDEKTGFSKDSRVKFIGTIYQQDLLKYLRQACRAYIHGHEVGGTNPGLLEALGHTEENLVLGVDFNKKVALDTVYYWDKSPYELTKLIDLMTISSAQKDRGIAAKKLIAERYTWDTIVKQYEALFQE
ncbi:TPA: DUF1972 domain-containing protein [Streptococcus suis]|nr:DUF1972 domain-containing protein [Streptococcus suis]